MTKKDVQRYAIFNCINNCSKTYGSFNYTIQKPNLLEVLPHKNSRNFFHLHQVCTSNIQASHCHVQLKTLTLDHIIGGQFRKHEKQVYFPSEKRTAHQNHLNQKRAACIMLDAETSDSEAFTSTQHLEHITHFRLMLTKNLSIKRQIKNFTMESLRHIYCFTEVALEAQR